MPGEASQPRNGESWSVQGSFWLCIFNFPPHLLITSVLCEDRDLPENKTGKTWKLRKVSSQFVTYYNTCCTLGLTRNTPFMILALGDWIEKFRTLECVDYFPLSVRSCKKMSLSPNRPSGVREEREYIQVSRNTVCWW